MNDDHGRIHNIHYGDILVKYGAIVNFEKDSIPFLNDNVVVNLNKNAEKFFNELVGDIKTYSEKEYRIYYVPVAKGNNVYYQDLQYSQRLEREL